jgi:hypothetical protein
VVVAAGGEKEDENVKLSLQNFGALLRLLTFFLALSIRFSPPLLPTPSLLLSSQPLSVQATEGDCGGGEVTICLLCKEETKQFFLFETESFTVWLQLVFF